MPLDSKKVCEYTVFMPLESPKFPSNIDNLGIRAFLNRTEALAAQVELLTHRLVEARMLIELQSKYILDQERRRMREMGGKNEPVVY